MRTVLSVLRRLFTRTSAAVVLGGLAERLGRSVRGFVSAGMARRASERRTLPSLYDVHPAASAAPRRAIGIRSVPLDRIVGTLRRPSQNTADFLPLRRLRGQNWQARWQRINGAMDRLATLPPIELVQVGDDYYVVDGHNRVAAALLADAIEIDADVTQLLLAGVARPGGTMVDASSLVGTEGARQAGTGRHSRTVEQRTAADAVTRQDLLRDDDR